MGGVALLALAAACTHAPAPELDRTGAPIVLAPCSIEGLESRARCGTASVFEDRSARRGRVLALRIVVVPARGEPRKPDPIVFLAGGPGQAATDIAADVSDGLATANQTRDLVFIDQRGTGRDSPLRCNMLPRPGDLDRLASGALPQSQLRACLAAMDADARLYTTFVAMDDLDDILGRMGYGAVNVIGGSYGTYAAQMLARMHVQRVRTLVLDGVVPADGDFPMRFAERVQRSFDQVVAECAADSACRTAFPDTRSELVVAQARLRARPVMLTNRRASAVFDGDAFAMLVRSFLGAPDARRYLPAVVHAAAMGRYDALADLVIDGQLGVLDSQSVGMYLTVSCTETVPHATVADAERMAAGSFLGAARAAPVVRACAFWPKGADIASLHEPLHNDVPALLMSGTVDNATALDDAQRVVAELPRGQWIIVPGGGHTVGGTPCMGDVIARFLDAPLATVDASCVRSIATRFALELPPG